MNNLSSNGISIVRNQTQINQQLMQRRMNLKDDYSRLNQLTNRRLSKNSLLANNQMCNDNNLMNNVTNLSNSRQTVYKLSNQNQSKQPQVKIGNIRRFQCNVDNCGQKFSSEILFNNHLKVLHNVDRNLINKSVNLGGNSGLNNLQLSTQNKSLNNLNNIKNLNNQQSNSLNNHLSNNCKSSKNLNSINNQFKLLLSNKTVDNSDPLSSYITNFKMLQTTKPNNNLLANNVDQLVTKVNSSIALPQKMYVPVSAINSLNLDQHNKQFLIAHTLDLSNDNQSNERIQIKNLQPPPTTRILFQCEIKNCLKRFHRKENLVDHLFDDHRVFEPEIIVNLDNSDDWLLLDDPKNKPLEEFELLNQALVKPTTNLTVLNREDEEDCRPNKLSRSYNEPSLATTLGIVKEVVTKIDNVNILNNISATSTYSNLNKSHVCNINGCTKSFNKRYHLVRHRLEAHQVGRLSLIKDILVNEKINQQQNDLNNSNENNYKPVVSTVLADKKDEKTGQQQPQTPKLQTTTISVAPTIVTTITTATYANPATNVVNNNNTVPSTFYIRRPPQDFRPYPCKFPNCGWSFKRSYHLKRHQKLHQNAKTPTQNSSDNNVQEIMNSEQIIKQDEEEEEEEDNNVTKNAIESSSTTSDHNESKKINEQPEQLGRTRRSSLRNDEVQVNGLAKKEEEEIKESESSLKEDSSSNSDKESGNKPVAKKIITRLSMVKKEEILEEEEEEEIEEEEIEEQEIEEDSTSQSQLESDDKSSTDKPLKTIKSNSRIETRKISTRQVKQETTTTDEENSCDISNNQQSIKCEFSSCNKRFTRQRQYDLHVKNHLQEKQKVQMSANKICATSNKLNKDDTIAETSTNTSTANTRSSRARRSDLNNNNLNLHMDNKLVDSQQLLLLCNPKEMIFLNPSASNESLKTKKGKLPLNNLRFLKIKYRR